MKKKKQKLTGDIKNKQAVEIPELPGNCKIYVSKRKNPQKAKERFLENYIKHQNLFIQKIFKKKEE